MKVLQNFAKIEVVTFFVLFSVLSRSKQIFSTPTALICEGFITSKNSLSFRKQRIKDGTEICVEEDKKKAYVFHGLR